MATLNVKDFPKYEQEINSVKSMDAELHHALSKYTGPAVGTEWDDKTGKLSIVPGWHADADGNVVRD